MNQEVESFLLTALHEAVEYRGHIKALCPFHDESTPSFFVYESRKYSGWFGKCHGCGWSGSLQRLLRKLKAPEQLLSFVPITINSPTKKQDDEVGWRPDSTLGYPPIYDYFLTRGISSEVCKQFDFKMDFNLPAAVMPVYFDYSYVGYIKRMLDPTLKKHQRYLIEPGTDLEEVLWGYDQVDKNEPVYVTEGIIDAACWWSIGKQGIALIGKQWQSKLPYLKTLKYPILVPDNGDTTSTDAFCKLQTELLCPFQFIPPEYKDTSEWFTDVSEEGWKK